MSNKNYFFLSGIPRSGSTLLASILNQNPEIYVSAESPLPEIMQSVCNQYVSNQNLDHDRSKDIYNVLDKTIPLFYEGYEEKYIIDKSFLWTEPKPYELLQKHLKNDIKIVCTVREPLEIFASWHRVSKNKSPDECAYFFQQDVINGITNMQRIIADGDRENILIIDYEDLIKDTEKKIDEVYEFLNIEKYSHDLSKIINPHEYRDVSGIKGQHEIKNKITKESYEIEKMFSSDTIKKYSGLDFWRKS